MLTKHEQKAKPSQRTGLRQPFPPGRCYGAASEGE